MKLTIEKMTIENFKGVKSFEVEPKNKNLIISGKNGAGKTSVYDAFLWLLFGKDSEGKKDFGLRPVDKAGNVIPKLVLCVEAELQIDGKAHTFRKEHREKVVKKQLRGYETLCWIDEVPKKVSEYADYINDIISEDIFKLLTDLHYFNEKLHWKDRRKVLLDIAGGDIQAPDGYDELVEAAGERTIDDYRQVLQQQKKRLNRERDEINPRIDELQKSLEEYATDKDTTLLEADRERLQAEMAKLQDKRKEIAAEEYKRRELIKKVNLLRRQIANREIELDRQANSDPYADKKQELNKQLEDCYQKLQDLSFTVKTQELKLKELERERDGVLKAVERCRADYLAMKEDKPNTICYACGQELTAEKIAELKDKKKQALSKIIIEGNSTKRELDKINAQVEQQADAVNDAIMAKDEQKCIYEEGLKYKDEQFAKYAAPEAKAADYQQDEQWQQLLRELEKAEKSVRKPADTQSIDAEISRMQQAIADISKTLAATDNIKKTTARIAELEQDEKRLSKELANVDRLLEMISQYKAAESTLIEKAVNSKFEYVKFKLFNELLNGSIEDCCEATLNGVPYQDLSYGQRILVGVDIINVLSEHHDKNVVLFIDNAESLTLKLETQSQTVKLIAADNVDGLQIINL
jgi:DNA repair exonuclease SbcCD ATPase subunit